MAKRPKVRARVKTSVKVGTKRTTRTKTFHV